MEENKKIMEDDWYENHPAKEYRRRNISTVYFFDTFPNEEKRQPTCFEDCSPEKQEEMLQGRSEEWLKHMVLLLSKKLKDISIFTDIIASEEE